MIRSDSRVSVVLLGAMTALTALAIDMSLPALPALSTEFDAAPERVQLTLSLFIIGYAIGQLFHGPLSDRFGRKPILIAGLVIYVAAAIVCALSRSIGRLLVHFSWRAIFVVLTLFAGTLFVVILFGFTESLTTPDADALRFGRLVRNYQTFLASRTCLGYALLNGLCWSGIFAFLSASPFVFIDIYGVAPEHYGYYFASAAVALVIGALSNKRLLRRHGHERVLRWGLIATVAGGAAVLIACATRWGAAAGVMAGFMLYIWGQAVVAPNALAAALEPIPHMAGTGAALMGAVQMGTGALAGYAVDAFYDGTPVPMGAVILAMALATVGIYMALLRRPVAT